MRSCTEAALEPLLRASLPTVELGLAPLPGVARFAEGETDTLWAAVRLMLAWRGLEADYSWLMGVSGTSFALAWRADCLCCPSVLAVHRADPFERVGAAVGWQFRRYGSLPFLKALEVLRKQLALDRPVLTSGLLGQTEWSAVVGVAALVWQQTPWHDEAPVPSVKVTARTPEDSDDSYTTVEVAPWSGYLPGRPVARLWHSTPLVWVEGPRERLLSTEVLQQSLTTARGYTETASLGGYIVGSDAWSAWSAQLRADDEVAALPLLEISRQAWSQAFILSRLAAARRTAVSFLLDAGEAQFSRAIGRLLALAAREYEEVADALSEARQHFPDDELERREAYRQADTRAAVAAILARCQRREKTAGSYLARALDRLG